MSIQLLKKGSNTDPDMEQYNKNLRRHHLRNIGIAAAIVCLAVLFAWGIQIGLQHRTYDVYEVVRSFERSDTVMDTVYGIWNICAEIQPGWNLLC